MSVDFAPTYVEGDVTGHRLVCEDLDEEIGRESSYSDALRVSRLHSQTCDACADLDGCFIYEITSVPRLIVSSANGAELLRVLGLQPEVEVIDGLFYQNSEGSVSAQDFLGRVLMAQGVAPSDPGIPWHDDSRPGGARVIQCGRCPEYVDEKLIELEAIAQWAIAHGRNVQWS